MFSWSIATVFNCNISSVLFDTTQRDNGQKSTKRGRGGFISRLYRKLVNAFTPKITKQIRKLNEKPRKRINTWNFYVHQNQIQNTLWNELCAFEQFGTWLFLSANIEPNLQFVVNRIDWIIYTYIFRMWLHPAKRSFHLKPKKKQNSIWL